MDNMQPKYTKSAHPVLPNTELNICQPCHWRNMHWRELLVFYCITMTPLKPGEPLAYMNTQSSNIKPPAHIPRLQWYCPTKVINQTIRRQDGCGTKLFRCERWSISVSECTLSQCPEKCQEVQAVWALVQQPTFGQGSTIVMAGED